MGFRLRSFRRYLTGAVALTVAVPIFVLGIAEHMSVSRLIESIDKERHDAAVLIAEGLGREVREAQSLVKLLAARLEEGGAPSTLRSFIERMQREFPEFLNIHADAPDGTCLLFASSEPAAAAQEGVSHAGRWHMKRQLGEPGHHMSGAFQGEGATDRWIVSLTSAAFGPDRQPVGYACAALNLSELAKRSLTSVPDSFAVTMTDAAGRVIWTNEAGLKTGDAFGEAGGSRYGGKAGVSDPSTGWQVSVGSPDHDIRRNDSIVIAGLVMLLTLLLTYFAGALLAKPLADAVERLADEIRGKPRKGLVPELPAELEGLRTAWLCAVDARDAAQSRLESLNRGLEHTVRERTAGIQAEKSLLDALIRSLYDGVVLYDDAGRAAVVNLQARALTGLHEGEHVFAQLAALMPELSDETSLAELPSEGRRLRTRGGKTLEAVPFEVPNAVRGRPAHGLILRDVTEIAALDALRAALVSVVAHEMKTPLAALRLQMSALAELLGKAGPDEAELIAGMTESTEALAGLINDWLDWSRIENRTLAVAPRLIRLDGVAAKAARIVKARFPELRILLEQPDGPAAAYADPDRMQQVFVNLFTNAARYRCEASPEIRLRFEKNAASGIIRITAADNGIGIDPGKAERIFDCFYQIDMGTTRRAGGTGLGLAICRGIMNALHGTIRVVYPKNNLKGSVFELTLPARPPLSESISEDDQ